MTARFDSGNARVMHAGRNIDLLSIGPCQRWMRYDGKQSMWVVIYWLGLSISPLHREGQWI